MQTILHIHFDGRCEEALHYYERELGGRIELLLPYEAAPCDSPVPADWNRKVMHARIHLGGQTVMACDAPPGCYEEAKGFSISLQFQDDREAERAFDSLAGGGHVRMPLQETFFARRFGMLVDRFGIPWIVNCEKAVMDLKQPENTHALSV